MSDRTEIKGNRPWITIQIFFPKIKNQKLLAAVILHTAWSWLGCAFVLAIYAFHPSGQIAYWFAGFLMLLVCAVVALALSALEKVTASYRRRYLLAVFLYWALYLAATVILFRMALLFARNFGLIDCLVGMFLLVGVMPYLLPAVVLALRSDKLSRLPVSIKLARPRFRHTFRMVALYIVYGILNFASIWFFENYILTGVLAYAVALLPMLPIFGLIPIYNQYMAEEQDEFQRHLFRRSILWALAGTLVIATVMERLEFYGLIFHRRPMFLSQLAFPLFWVAQQMVLLVNVMVLRFHEQREKRSR